MSVARDPDWTHWDAEGLPDLAEQPPGIDAETAEEGSFPPRDYPLGVEEWGTTATEELAGEPLELRLSREVPDVLPQADEEY